MYGVLLREANLEGAGLEGARFEGVYSNETTMWPEGVDPVATGARFAPD